MSFLDRFKEKKPRSANVARDRLQIIVAHERNQRIAPSYLAALQNDILAVVKKYVDIDSEQVNVNVSQQENKSILEMNICLPK